MHQPTPTRHTYVPPGDRRLLAQLIITTWSQPGALIADLDDDPATAATAAATGRRYYHPTSDELTNPRTNTGWADLVVFGWPHPPADPHPPASPHSQIVTCRRLLRPDGRVVIVITGPTSARRTHLRVLTRAAGDTGLRPVEHVACIDQDQPTASAHTDLLILVTDTSDHKQPEDHAPSIGIRPSPCLPSTPDPGVSASARPIRLALTEPATTPMTPAQHAQAVTALACMISRWLDRPHTQPPDVPATDGP